MKKLSVIIFLIYLCACTKDSGMIPDQAIELSYENNEIHKIDKEKALEIATLYFGQTQTRSTSPFLIEYVTNQTMTRNNSTYTDTLAYILNRGTQDGFVIISSDNRVYPILAHSETGNFKYEKGDIIDKEFISRIGAYIEENKTNTFKEVTTEDLASCYVSSPALATSWNQGAPFDKYVIQEYPGCPAGCVAVAISMIMAHCKSSLIYHGIAFDFKRINAGLKLAANSNEKSSSLTRIIGGGDPPILEDGTLYTYEKAADYAAKLVYWTGRDAWTTYTPGSSSASAYAAYSILLKQGYDVKNKLEKYNVHKAIRHLVNKEILYMKGSNITSPGRGHVWIADACRYCVNEFTNDTLIAEIHCNWGWGESYNEGYYSGEVFSAGGYSYGSLSNFAVGVK